MFYSQFILAKKGPLGTIWIAAHLERKLRKNQVADTDIGVSVDSILFPEAPIALRLSSHLLLGVVRIYSRKVNYLFHDCSEALLKIKQAFRSTAVDLPPEESTAPYHSITLPETFDLDDFELPDNAFFHGNFVDHHISTREQITLQDTMDGLAYSTSQFGLDERFGDGDASQIGLELDEGLFLDKVSSAMHASDTLGFEEENVDLQTSIQPVTNFKEMDIDGAETSKDMPELLGDGCENLIDTNIKDPNIENDSACLHGDGIQPPDVNEVLPHGPIEGSSAEPDVMDVAFPAIRALPTDLIESAQAPSTPGLIEEAIPANVQEGPTLSLSRNTYLPNDVEGFMPDTGYNSHLESEDPDSTKSMPKVNLVNQLIEPDDHVGGSDPAVGFLSLNDRIEAHSVPGVENESPPLGSLQNAMVKKQEDSPSTIMMGPILPETTQSESSAPSILTEPNPNSPVPGCPDRTATQDELCRECGREISLQNKVLYNAAPSLPFDDKTNTNAKDIAAVCPGCSLKAPSLEAPCNEPTVSVVTIAANSLLTTDCESVSDGISEVENVPSKHKSEPLACKSVNPLETLKSSFHACHVLQACSSLENGHSVEITPNLSSSEIGLCTAETEGRETLHTGGTPAEVQGEDCSTDITDTNSKTPQMLEPALSEIEIKADLNKPDGYMENVTSNDTQLMTLNCSTSSELPAPEIVVLAPVGAPDLVDELVVQSTANEEGEGSVDRFKNLSGKKRHSMESTPVLQNDNSAKFSGVSRYKRSMDYIPDDDDVLSSILVGRRTPFLKMRPTPPPPQAASLKRPRMTPRVNVPKRKVLLDDTMVLHGDAIRQQLTSTEDIRRIRRKAPCTHREIWMIQKYLLEDEIFNEPLFTGMSAELSELQNESYCLRTAEVSNIDMNHSFGEVSGDLEPPRSPAVIKETGVEGMGEPIADKNDVEAQEATETVVLMENQPCEHPSSSLGCDAQVQTEALTDTPVMKVDLQGDGHSVVAANQAAIIGAEVPIPDSHSGDACNTDFSIEPYLQKSDVSCLSSDQKSVIQPTDDLGESTGKILQSIESTFVEKDNSIADRTNDSTAGMVEVNDGTLVLANGSFIAKDASIVPEIERGISVDVAPISLPQKCDDFEEIANDKNCAVEIGTDMLIDSLASGGNVNPSLPDVTLESNERTAGVIVTDDLVIEGISKGTSDVVDDVDVVNKVTNDGGGPSSNFCHTEMPQLSSTCPLQLNTNTENVLQNGGEENLTGCQEVELESAMDVEMPVADVVSMGDSCDFGHMLDGNDTEFLNVDDEAEPLEEEDNNMSSAVEGRFLENSGWSSRTRAVAKYLQSLFDDEAGHVRKVLPVDQLLAGKTRKEASRMFFETLVLKTKDYIHVEQENPFENINIKPRVKLLKSEFESSRG
ncbi:sister chromatid cohesion 1 protein 4-like [Tasmannia lanceolata]|uniref:sister chromatid cohesion 1 protein 4-like n=1 Tax=Tasmannia lanceolata TaxID=3420 RepID=UPI004062AD5E